jgi:hypothetical protein
MKFFTDLDKYELVNVTSKLSKVIKLYMMTEMNDETTKRHTGIIQPCHFVTRLSLGCIRRE